MSIIATSAEGGFKMVADEHPHAVIVQQKLGDLNGDVFANAVKEEHRIPVLIVKSETLNALMGEFNFDKLATKIRELVNGPV
jgi:DNA-binding response OmpR family regulator